MRYVCVSITVELDVAISCVIGAFTMDAPLRIEDCKRVSIGKTQATFYSDECVRHAHGQDWLLLGWGRFHRLHKSSGIRNLIYKLREQIADSDSRVMHRKPGHAICSNFKQLLKMRNSRASKHIKMELCDGELAKMAIRNSADGYAGCLRTPREIRTQMNDEPTKDVIHIEHDWLGSIDIEVLVTFFSRIIWVRLESSTLEYLFKWMAVGEFTDPKSDRTHVDSAKKKKRGRPVKHDRPDANHDASDGGDASHDASDGGGTSASESHCYSDDDSDPVHVPSIDGSANDSQLTNDSQATDCVETPQKRGKHITSYFAPRGAKVA